MKKFYLNTFCFFLIIIYVVNPGSISAGISDEATVSSFIRDNIEQIKRFKFLEYRGESVSAVDVLPVFYENREYRPAWKRESIRDLFTEIYNIDKDGLNPRDYHINLITEILHKLDNGNKLDPRQYAISEIFLTDSLLRLGYHLRHGKVDPESLDPNWNLPKVLNRINASSLIAEVLKSGSIGKYFENLKPSHFYYKRMKNALAHYRQIKLDGGWETIQAGPSLKLGMTGQRVLALRKRLFITEDLTDKGPEDQALFDKFLEHGVIEFQRRHGLVVDGIAGVQTINALNVPVDERIDQIRVNLERSRWVLHDLPSKFLIVNIAGFTAYFVKNGEPVWRSKVVVGKTYRKTPVFRADITYIVFNPTWTVPPTILRNDMLPAIKRNPAYLWEKNIKVLDHNGSVIPRSSIRWAAYTGKNFPYILRQDPGPENALGLVKFMFPNKHFVFLHDTPAKSLFDKDVRTFSSGCIRIDKPFELAELILSDQENWNGDAIRAAIDQKRTRTADLHDPIPILILYWTSRVNDEGKIEFLPDVYQRDPSVLHYLDATFN